MNKNNFDESDNEFFEEATKEIYKWLPLHKKVKLNNELLNEGVVGLKDLNVTERFFRLLHFIDVNYIKPVDWCQQTVGSIKRINTPIEVNNFQLIKVELKEGIYLDEISEKLAKSEIKKLFFSTLEEIGVKDRYEKYLKDKKEGRMTYE